MLSYLPLKDVNAVANTSKTLTQLLTILSQESGSSLHETLQLFREYKGHKNGYQILQQSNLPEWLKTRWSAKRHMLTAISQGKIALEVNGCIPITDLHTPINEKVALMEAWPKLVISISRHSLVIPENPLIDTLSLQALVPEYRVGLQLNDERINTNGSVKFFL